jgi:nitrate reductase NapE component
MISLAKRQQSVHTITSSIAGRDKKLIATLLLTCAVLTSLALGVLVAYGICLGLFRIFLLHVNAVARRVPAVTATLAKN